MVYILFQENDGAYGEGGEPEVAAVFTTEERAQLAAYWLNRTPKPPPPKQSGPMSDLDKLFLEVYTERVRSLVNVGGSVLPPPGPQKEYVYEEFWVEARELID